MIAVEKGAFGPMEAVVLVLTGLMTGAVLASPVVASGQSGCPIETWTADNGPNVRWDDNDGVDEINRWYLKGGDDFGRAYVCDDDDLQGDDGRDDIGGGSGGDWIEGDAGDDWLFGGAASDIVWGWGGSDQIEDNQGPATGTGIDTDNLSGNDGNNDDVRGQDGDVYDSVSGDAGTGDSCSVDHTSERTGGCES